MSQFCLLSSYKLNVQQDIVVEMLSEVTSENKSKQHLLGLVKHDPGGSLFLDIHVIFITHFHCVVLASLEFATYTRLTLYLQTSTCLCLPSVGSKVGTACLIIPALLVTATDMECSQCFRIWSETSGDTCRAQCSLFPGSFCVTKA